MHNAQWASQKGWYIPRIALKSCKEIASSGRYLTPDRKSTWPKFSVQLQFKAMFTDIVIAAKTKLVAQ